MSEIDAPKKHIHNYDYYYYYYYSFFCKLKTIKSVEVDKIKVKGKEEPVKIYAPRFEDAYNQKGIRKLKK